MLRRERDALLTWESEVLKSDASPDKLTKVKEEIEQVSYVGLYVCVVMPYMRLR